MRRRNRPGRPNENTQRPGSLVGFSRGLSSALLLLAVVALVSLARVHQSSRVGSTDAVTASERDPERGAFSGKPRVPDQLTGTAPATDIFPDPETSEWPVPETPALEGNWTRELRELKEIALQNPEAALARAAELSVGEEREAAVKEVCLQIASRDPALAVEAAWRLELGKLGGRAEGLALENLGSQWAVRDLPAALAWVREQPVDETGRRDRIIKGIVAGSSQQPPAETARVIAESMSPNYVQFDAAMNFVGRWAATDFPGAAAWVDLFPEGPLRERGRKELLKGVPGQGEFTPAE